jgi:hypothetical protein
MCPQQQKKADARQDNKKRDHVWQPGGGQEEPEKALVISEPPVEWLERAKALVEPEEETLQDQQGNSGQDQGTRLPRNTEIIYDPQARHEEHSKSRVDDTDQEEHIHNLEIIAPCCL